MKWRSGSIGCSLLRAATAALLLTWTGVATAEDQDAKTETKLQCAQAYEQAQRLRRDGALLSARAQAISCAQPVCPAVLSSDCTKWSKELDEAIPTHVFELLDSSGQALTETQFKIDSGEFQENAGQALLVDPGSHELVLRSADGREQSGSFVATAGKRNVLVQLQLPEVAVPTAEPLSFPATVPTPSWVLGGVSVAGFGAFAVLGAIGKGKESALPCTEEEPCDWEEGQPARNFYTAADVSLIVGATALVSGLVWWWVAPRTPQPQAAQLSFQVLPRGAGLQFGGKF